MFNGNNGPSLADIAAVTNNNDGFGGNNGWWVLIILFALFGGWGNGGFGMGAGSGVGFTLGVPATQADVFNQSLVSKLDGVTYGIADSTYALNNAITSGFAAAELGRCNDAMAQMQANFAIQQALSDCCCQNREAIAQVRFDNATNTCAITTAINTAAQQIMQNDNANYRALHDENVAMQIEAKNNKIADQKDEIAALRLTASQIAQNQYLISQLRTDAAAPATAG